MPIASPSVSTSVARPSRPVAGPATAATSGGPRPARLRGLRPRRHRCQQGRDARRAQSRSPTRRGRPHRRTAGRPAGLHARRHRGDPRPRPARDRGRDRRVGALARAPSVSPRRSTSPGGRERGRDGHGLGTGLRRSSRLVNHVWSAVNTMPTSRVPARGGGDVLRLPVDLPLFALRSGRSGGSRLRAFPDAESDPTRLCNRSCRAWSATAPPA